MIYSDTGILVLGSCLSDRGEDNLKLDGENMIGHWNSIRLRIAKDLDDIRISAILGYWVRNSFQVDPRMTREALVPASIRNIVFCNLL